MRRLLRPRCCWWIPPLLFSSLLLRWAHCHPALAEGNTAEHHDRPIGVRHRRAAEESYWAYSAALSSRAVHLTPRGLALGSPLAFAFMNALLLRK
ncbi:hypothetical protein QQF64_003135 [Cirrhinus molitorella]|uniref:Secreted protein n=1 Tax=Cirrhinus molitorella TaxID=172907 RepID=A0ABR3MJ67_9TELE